MAGDAGSSGNVRAVLCTGGASFNIDTRFGEALIGVFGRRRVTLQQQQQQPLTPVKGA